MIRLFGRFHDSKIGISTRVLLETVKFSTFQTLENSELFILDKINDSFEEFEKRVIGMASHLERNSKDPTQEVNWPYVFLMRVKEIYRANGKTFDLKDFKSSF